MDMILNIGVDVMNTVANVVVQIPVVEQAVNALGSMSGLGTGTVLSLLVIGALFTS